MSRLTESAIKLFERLSYSYVYAPDITLDDKNLERNLTNGKVRVV